MLLTRWYELSDVKENLKVLADFLSAPRIDGSVGVPAMSLFSGAGISDLGYERAGFNFITQVELDEDRAHLCERNFPQSQVLQTDITKSQKGIIESYRNSTDSRLHLLSITPPCQGMSSSNPGRGKVSKVEDRDKRNKLILAAIPIIEALLPRIVVIENVSQILKEVISTEDGESRHVIDVFRDALSSCYRIFTGIVQVADYGIPQTRKRAIAVAIHQDEPCLTTLDAQGALPWMRAKHSADPEASIPWLTVGDWFSFRSYPTLDARTAQTSSCPTDGLHRVPHYGKTPDRYHWIADIPARSGKNAYQNANCRSCDFTPVPEKITLCPSCNIPMRNRPYVIEKDGTFRLVKGFHSSYRRMSPDKPAPTVMTNSSHLGSDYKIHPWENRVLSIRECADLQTIPSFYDWSWAFQTGHVYVTRQVIGEALPSWFTYLHGLVLRQLLSGQVDVALLERQGLNGKRRSGEVKRVG